MNDEQVNDSETESDDVVVDDDALEMAAGGSIQLPPRDGSGGYTYNTTYSFN